MRPAADASLLAALRRGPVVLDGGLATWLEAAGHDLSDDLWSARLLADAPDAIAAAHTEFIEHGARVVTTASYQATVDGFVRRGHDPDHAAELIRSSVDIARAVADATRVGPVWVAASVGPYGAALADGSEYRGNYGLSTADLVRFHRPRIALLAEAAPDVLALETVPDVREAEALLTLLEPTREDSPIAKFLAQRGPGIHHLCLGTDDVRQDDAKLRAAGLKVLRPEPTIGAGGCEVQFVHPKSAGGVLLELSQAPEGGGH